jgi:hypothetical protein
MDSLLKETLMFKSIKSLVAVSVLSVAGATSLAMSPTTADFVGVWNITVTPDSTTQSEGQQEFRDALLFHQGQLTAEAFGKFGFRPGTYATSDANGFPSFVSMLVSTDRGETVWTGELGENDTLSGSLVWVRPDGSTYRYTVSGTRDTDGDGVGPAQD